MRVSKPAGGPTPPLPGHGAGGRPTPPHPNHRLVSAVWLPLSWALGMCRFAAKRWAAVARGPQCAARGGHLRMCCRRQGRPPRCRCTPRPGGLVTINQVSAREHPNNSRFSSGHLPCGLTAWPGSAAPAVTVTPVTVKRVGAGKVCPGTRGDSGRPSSDAGWLGTWALKCHTMLLSLISAEGLTSNSTTLAEVLPGGKGMKRRHVCGDSREPPPVPLGGRHPQRSARSHFPLPLMLGGPVGLVPARVVQRPCWALPPSSAS